jgi:2-polyprenyl-3-methyl-5-hydroxy-6-metoxy-1,4-benzoquinol methylase
MLVKNVSAMTCAKNINQSRLLLKKLRGGDYAHIGGVAIVDMIFATISTFNPAVKTAKILDVGSGLGGTAQYLYQKGFTDIYGIDIDEDAVRHASKEYPNISFKAVDVLEVDTTFTANNFNLLYLFNVIYAIENKEELFKKLVKICAPQGILVILDFVEAPRTGLHIKDLTNQSMRFVKIQTLRKLLKKAGWKILKEEDFSSESIDWYKKDIETLRTIKNKLLKEFSQASVVKAEKIFSSIVNSLQHQTLSSVVIYAQKDEATQN